MPPVSGTSLPALRPSATRLTPYAASGLAEHQLRIEEQRVRDKMAERLRRKEAKSKEVLRRKVVALAMEEMSRQPDPRASAAEMDEQKRYLAYLGTLRSDERYFHQRSNPHARWYEATLDEREARDAAWCQRRVEHRMVSDARTSQIMAHETSRASRLLAASDARLANATNRHSAVMQARVDALATSASAPALRKAQRSNEALHNL